jgi:signal transduction histidine kinase
MSRRVFTLTPPRVQFEQFWVEIKKRNRWLINLRYGAVVMITCLIIGVGLIEDVTHSFHLNTLPHWIIAASILLYNLVFHKIWKYTPEKKPEKGFHSMHFSLLQICVDFVALMLFVYFTGGIETPLFALFIFHVIIGSLLLTSAVMNIIITLMLALSFIGALLECNGIIPHNKINGINILPLYNDFNYLIVFFILFGITFYISSYLANSIAKNLYRRERALTKALDELEGAEKAKSKYVMTVVHDLKTPIAAAITYLDMLTEGSYTKLQPELVKPVERSKARLHGAIQIINDILHISQLKLESSADNVTEILIINMLEDIVADLHVMIESKGIRLTINAVNRDYMLVKAEPKLLRLALANLLSNAVKYTDKNGIIEIIVSKDKDQVSISIADNGIGIPENEIGKLFNDFYRSSLSKKKGIEGTGLGLSIVKQTIEKYGGTIEVRSPSYLKSDENSPGSQFVIKMPGV